ncbi:MAG: DsbA family protein [Treponema sp.]|nr:DsbA family protein [Treponema sp.]
MKKFQLFYDYECPYCKKGHESLMELLPQYPEIEIEWRPIEAHPRPEDHHPHSDLAVVSFYIARDLGADMEKFHALMYQAVSIERRNIEDPEILFNIIKNIIDRNKFFELLNSGKYASRVTENNDLAYEKEGVWFVPAFRAGDLKLDAQGGIGVSKKEVKDFLDKLTIN